jgi:NADPH:quinone reductase-like Zn-dependent oxidoreductase
VIDYAARDFTQEPARYDLVMDNVGNAPYSRVRHLLKPGGRYLMVIGDLLQMLAAAGRRDVVSASQADAAFNAFNYRLLMDMLAAGRIRAVIDRSFPLEKIDEAHRLVDTGHKRGSVVITVGASGRTSVSPVG